MEEFQGELSKTRELYFLQSTFESQAILDTLNVPVLWIGCSNFRSKVTVN